MATRLGANGVISFPDGTQQSKKVPYYQANWILNTDVTSNVSPVIPFYSSTPTKAQKIYLLFNGVGLSGTDTIKCNLGDSGGVFSGINQYASYVQDYNTTSTAGTVSADHSGWRLTRTGGSGYYFFGIMELTRVYTTSTNIWDYRTSFSSVNTFRYVHGNGYAQLGSTQYADRITLASSGTNTFTSGNIRIIVY